MVEFTLPSGWHATRLDSVAEWGSGGTPSRKKAEYYNGTIPWVKTGDLGPRLLCAATEHITEEAVANSSAKFFPKGSVAIAMYGATIGKTSILGIDATTNQACAVANPISNLTTSEFLYYFLRNEKEAFIAKGKGGAQPNISQTLIKEHEICLPPLAEQKIIAQKLDTLLAQVESTKARLERTRETLKRFRQSVLAAAVSGKLTEEWREQEGLPKFGEITWEGILRDKKESFKRGPFGSALKKSMFVEEGYKVYEQYCPINDDCSYARYFITPEKFEEMRAFEVKDGDFLISCSGVSLGRITQVPEGSEPGIINQALLRVRLNNSLYDDTFFKLVFRSPEFQKAIFANSTGSAIPNLKGVKELKAMLLPLPTPEEQTEIVRRVEQLFAHADTIEKQTETALARVNNLTQSILAKAFRGELTAQWRAENPELISGENSAEALLERIKAERATVSTKKGTTKKSRKPRTPKASKTAGA